jgi:surfeit locus 1 family protein
VADPRRYPPTVAPRLRQGFLIVITIVVAATCVRLGFWQLDRLHGRREINAMLEVRGAAPIAPIASVDPAALPYRHVMATGTYDRGHEWILSGRTQDGTAGNHVLTPLILNDGAAVVVDRGWVPLEDAGVPVSGTAAAPGGRVTVTGLALPPDDVSAPAISPAPNITTRIDLGRGGLPYRLLPVYVLLQTQDPPQDLPAIIPPPILDEGPHLSYAIQWFAFATIAVIGGGILLNRERRE